MTEVNPEPAAAFQELLLGAEELQAYLSEAAVLTLTLLGNQVLGCSLLIDRPRRTRAEGHSDDRTARMAEPAFAEPGPAAEAIVNGYARCGYAMPGPNAAGTVSPAAAPRTAFGAWPRFHWRWRAVRAVPSARFRPGRTCSSPEHCGWWSGRLPMHQEA